MTTSIAHSTFQATGPKTESGKLESSKNALKHGLTSESIHRFPAEIRDAYSEFLATQYAEFNPETITESDYLEQYAFNRFQLNRAQPMLAAAMDALAADPDNEILEKRYARLTRHVRALERSARAALNELRTFITDRLLAAELSTTLQEQLGGNAPAHGITFPVAFPSHRLLDQKSIKRTQSQLTLRFVQDNHQRSQASAITAS